MTTVSPSSNSLQGGVEPPGGSSNGAEAPESMEDVVSGSIAGQSVSLTDDNGDSTAADNEEQKPTFSSLQGLVINADAPQLAYPPRPVTKLSSRDPTDINTSGRLRQVNRFHQSNKVELPELGEADCCFWEGKGVEDRSSEAIIKNGYMDKAQLLNEGNSGRQSLWPHLKSRSGLQNLSTFFGAAFQQRQDLGQVPAGSSFKPPPRVTLTDSKREAWLRELADDAVPLRKLSRTIPHGVRGKSLLEHCMLKKVAIPRAVWLAKCVGANELRAFRRKGISSAVAASNETKWVREWTGIVEDFLEQVMNTVKSEDSKDSLIYALRLTGELSAQNLLDRRHFLTWLCAQLASSPFEKLSAIVVLVDILSRQFQASLKAVQRLAQACAVRIGSHLGTDKLFDHPLMSRLFNIFAALCKNCPKAIILSDNWPQCYRTLCKLKVKATGVLQHNLDDIIAFNQRRARIHELSESTAATRSTLTDLLISVSPTTDLSNFTTQCMSRSRNKLHLTATLIQWASTLHRSGDWRIYTASAIIRGLRRAQIDTDELIMQSLSLLRDASALSPEDVGRLIYELFTWNDFDTPRYLRWLLATGVINDIDDVHKDIIIRPVLDLPVDGLSPQAASLRRMITREIGLPVDSTQCIDQARDLIKASLMRPHFDGVDDLVTLQTLDSLLSSQASALATSSLLANCILETVKERAAEDDDLEISSKDIVVIRQVLGSTKDYRRLASVLRQVIQHADQGAVMAIADTVVHFYEEFASASILLPLTSSIVDRYRLLRTRNGPYRDFILSIAPLALLFKSPGFHQFVQREQDLCQQYMGMAACTPASDSIVDLTMSSGLSVEEELERVFSSGNTMDDPTLRRVFGLILRAPLSGQSSANAALAVASSLSRLRPYDQRCFDECMKEWISDQLQAPSDDIKLDELAPLLVGCDCIALSAFIEICINICEELHDRRDGSCSRVATHGLSILCSQPSDQVEQTRRPLFRFQTQRRAARLKTSKAWVVLTDHGCRCGTQAENTKVMDVLEHDRETRILQYATQNNLSHRWLLDLGGSAEAPGPLICREIDPASDLSFKASDPPTRMKTLIIKSDPFSLQVFNFYLHETMHDQKLDLDVIQDVLFDAARAGVASGNDAWQQLIVSLDARESSLVRNQVERDLLNDLEILIHAPDISIDVKSRLTSRMLVIQTLGWTIKSDGNSDIAFTIVKDFQEAADLFIHSTQSPHPDPNRAAVAETCIRVLLQLAVIHTSSFGTTGYVDANLQAYLITIASLYALRSSSGITPELRNDLYEAAAHLVVSFSFTEDSLVQIANDLGAASRDPTIRFLLGLRDQTDAWLHLTTGTRDSNLHLGAIPSTQYPIKQWEMFSNAAPTVSSNDTPLSLRLFDARKLTRP